LALLLLLIPRARSTVVIVLLVVMFAVFLFGAKSLGMQIPWADKMLARVATSSQIEGGIGMVRLGELATLLKSGGQTRNFRGLWGGRGVLATYQQRDSSVKMVKGIQLDGKGGQAELASAFGSSLPKAGRGTNGVPTPDEAKKMSGGVPLDEKELLAGLVKNAPGQKEGEGNARSDSLDLLKKALQRGHAVSPGSEVQFPGIRGAAWGDDTKLGAWSRGSGGGSILASNGAVGTHSCTSNQCARHNLAEVKALACASAPPGTACNTGISCQAGRCPGEYAYHTGDAPYSGGEAGGGILTTATEPVPITPDAQASLQSEYANANRDENCTRVFMQNHQSNQSYETQLNQQFQSCCAAVAASYNNCWQSCTSSCFLLIFCTSHCHTTCNPPAAAAVQNCTNVFISGHNSYANAQYSNCPGSARSSAVNPSAVEPWAPNCGSY